MSAIIDLTQSDHPILDATSEICIIGAGAAGLYLASRLSRAGLGVTILEAGGAASESCDSIGFRPTFTASEYGGALDGRAFGLGGSTSRWGGLLIPHSELDIRGATIPESAVWKHIVKVVRERSVGVFANLGLRGRPDFVTFPKQALNGRATKLERHGFQVLASDFLPVRRRNLAYLAKQIPCTIYLNATATRWLVNPHAEGENLVEGVEAASGAGTRLRISARTFVIAAGAIESARILLEIDRATNARMLPQHAWIGRGLSDHLSCRIADVRPEDRDIAAGQFGPVFSKGRLRTFRYVQQSTDLAVPRHFAHFIFEIDNAGFRLLKDVIDCLQAKKPAAARHLMSWDGAVQLSRFTCDRIFRSRLHVPARTPVHLQLDVEQTPDPGNRISLGTDLDRYGRPKAVVAWRINQVDYESIETLSRRLLAAWPARSLGFPELTPTCTAEARSKPYDAYHPVGTCRMGADDCAPVDLQLRVKGTQNLFVASTGTFPSAGTANPTFSMFCLADQLADELISGSRQIHP